MEFATLKGLNQSATAQSLAKALLHVVFSTKERRPFLRDIATRDESIDIGLVCDAMQPFQGCELKPDLEPRVVARASRQPWAELSNPFGIVPASASESHPQMANL